MPNEDILRQRNRVVDHWKRMFAILCGFAITVACQRMFTSLVDSPRDPVGLYQFLAFIVTVPPIFHGLERSLDLRYLSPTSEVPGPRRMLYDSFVLVLTGLFFMGIALSIADRSQVYHPSKTWWSDKEGALHQWFFVFLGGFFLFDSIILLRLHQRIFGAKGTQDGHHRNLAILNLIAGLAVLMAFVPFELAPSLPTGIAQALQKIDYPSRFLAVALIMIARTVLDYHLAARFLYPQEPLNENSPRTTTDAAESG